MKLCFVVDARSAIARNWIEYIVAAGHEVHVISSQPCDEPLAGIVSFMVAPIGLARLRGGAGGGARVGGGQPSRVMRVLKRFDGSVVTRGARHLRHWVSPLELELQVQRVRAHVRVLRPDVVHAMRVPFEGMLAARALDGVPIPLLVSIWGNDFTLIAPKNPLLGMRTRQAMRRADAIHPDCARDLALASEWGFDAAKPATVLPSAGGVQAEVFYPGEVSGGFLEKLGLPTDRTLVLNPRGVRPYVRNDTFFAAVALLRKRVPDVHFVGLAMAGNRYAESEVARWGIADSVTLLPALARPEVAELFRASAITVSPSMHDGTPNTLLEGMACGAVPAAGNIESVREWITDGRNGLLFDPGSPESMADAIVRAISDPDFRQRARDFNQGLIARKAHHDDVMRAAEAFYEEVVRSCSHRAVAT